MKRKMIELRFLVRGGDRVLQMREFFQCWSDWQDVPVVEEEGE